MKKKTVKTYEELLAKREHVEETHGALVDYVDGTLQKPERILMEKHLAQCPACRLETIQLRKDAKFLHQKKVLQEGMETLRTVRMEEDEELTTNFERKIKEITTIKERMIKLPAGQEPEEQKKEIDPPTKHQEKKARNTAKNPTKRNSESP